MIKPHSNKYEITLTTIEMIVATTLSFAEEDNAGVRNRAV
jgi:hypothetical protein